MQHFRLDRIPDNLLREPLEFLVADHVRQRKVCHALDALVLGMARPGTDAAIAAIVDYLSVDLPLHVADEEFDLFPALLHTNGHHNEIPNLIDGLKSDHARELALARNVAAFLREKASSFMPGGGAGDLASFSQTFTECVRSHLAVEDEMLLPLAKKRLSGPDLIRIGRSMAARRQIDYPE